jgi:hypothetical protein
MPYKCAKAICATFCYSFAAALIPLFGPEFPSQCTPPHSTHFSSMTINRALIREAAENTRPSRQGSVPQQGAGPGLPPQDEYRPRADAMGRIHRLMSPSPLGRGGLEVTQSNVDKVPETNDMSRPNDQGPCLPSVSQVGSSADLSLARDGYCICRPVERLETTSLRRLRQISSTPHSCESSTRRNKRPRLNDQFPRGDEAPKSGQSTRTELPQGRLSKETDCQEQEARIRSSCDYYAAETLVTMGRQFGSSELCNPASAHRGACRRRRSI